VARPYTRFCIASAMAKVCRLHPRSKVIGCRYKPKVCRVPSASVSMMPPQSNTATGIRHGGGSMDLFVIADRIVAEGGDSPRVQPRQPACMTAASTGRRKATGVRARIVDTVFAHRRAGQGLGPKLRTGHG